MQKLLDFFPNTLLFAVFFLEFWQCHVWTLYVPGPILGQRRQKVSSESQRLVIKQSEGSACCNFRPRTFAFHVLRQDDDDNDEKGVGCRSPW